MTQDVPSSPPRDTGAPTPGGDRITTLDAIRGVAVLGILVMNAVSFALSPAAYVNLSAGGSHTWLDWLVGGLGEVFVDQKFMGLFSLLFGASIVLFADRAVARGARPVLLSLWRNALLLVIGLAHTMLWDGDILTVYALCAPVVLALRSAPPRVLAGLGAALMLLPAALTVPVQAAVPDDGSGLGGFWTVEGTESDAVGGYLLVWAFARALGMMLIGVALYRWGVLQGARPAALYRRMAVIGFGVGIPLAAAGLAIQVATGFSGDVAVLAEAPNTLATLPMVLGYVGLLTLWNARGEGAGRARIRAVGRMALSNYLAQTVLGLTVLGLLAPDDVGRAWLVPVIVGVWALQLWWSPAWLARFRYGPVEWLWRSATYRRPARFRHAPAGGDPVA